MSLVGGLRTAVFQYPVVTYGSLSFALATAALGPVPSFAPLVMLLSILRLASRGMVPRERGGRKFGSIAAAAALGASVRHAPGALHATSSAVTSLSSLLLLSALSTSLATAVVLVDRYLTSRMKVSYAQALLFPALWASIWAAVSTSPVGRLFAWSPAMVQVDWYAWLAPYGGSWGIDWIVASWAAVLSEVVGALLMDTWRDQEEGEGAETAPLIAVDDEEVVQAGTPAVASSRMFRNPTLVLAFVLLLLASPAVLTERALPLPVVSQDTLALTVGCVLPGGLAGGYSPGFDAFIAETKTLVESKIVLWPEGAVRFESAQDREEKLTRIQTEVLAYKANGLVGVSFEESVPAAEYGSRYLQRNGFLLLSREGVIHEYYKRNLVPIAESFKMIAGNESAALTTIDYPISKKGKKVHTVLLDVTSAICMDFASAAPFSALAARPALILAPARTWDIRAGTAMWAHARARAAELGAGALLWCDGGEGGISGIAGTSAGANGRIMRVGQGSWQTEVPIPWPFEADKTPYARYGDWSIFALVWGIVSLGIAIDGVNDVDFGGAITASGALQAAKALVQTVKERGRRLTAKPRQGEGEPLLG